MNKLVLLLVAIFAVGSFAQVTGAPELKFLWHSWKQIYNKVYTEVEEVERFTVFVENYLKVVKHNAEDNGFRMALNQFADLTKAEFKKQNIKGLLITEEDREEKKMRQALDFYPIDYSILALPASVDWRDKGAVTPVKDQGQCGSCWAFSTTGSLEGLNFVKTGKLLSFSEQQLVDCETQDQGCNGGLMDHGFAYAAQKGLELETDYPYKAVDGKCQYAKKKANKVNTGFKDVAANDANALKTALVTQTVSVAIEADEDSFQFYSSGVIKSGCGASLDHGVLAVGYTKVKGAEAFIVKNSWADTWGDKGYVMISTDGKANDGAGVCGILSMASYPTA